MSTKWSGRMPGGWGFSKLQAKDHIPISSNSPAVSFPTMFRRTSKFILALVMSCAFVPLVCAQSDPASTNANSTNLTYAIISRDANSRHWVKVLSQTNASGQVATTTNKAYTELATGICYQQGGAGTWLDSVEHIDIVTGTNSLDNSTTFIGNWVYGERCGALSFEAITNNQTNSVINLSGNWLNLSPVLNGIEDYPGAAAAVQFCQTLNILGNTLVTGGYGADFGLECGDALIMANDFSGATYRGIGDYQSYNSPASAQVFRNRLGEGVSFHVQIPYTSSFGWFFSQNQYLNGTNVVAPFVDPVASEAHISN